MNSLKLRPLILGGIAGALACAIAICILLILLSGMGPTKPVVVMVTVATVAPPPTDTSPSRSPTVTSTAMLPPTTFTPTAVNRVCIAPYLTRLSVGLRAYVIYNPPDPNRVREQAGTQYAILGLIYPGEPVLIIDGPVCSNEWIWWKVRSERSGITGWTSEGDGQAYWLVPMSSP